MPLTEVQSYHIFEHSDAIEIHDGILLPGTTAYANHQGWKKKIERVKKLRKKSEPSWVLNPGPSDY